MKLHVPNYYKNFKCRADKCKNTCCKDWEIDIDDSSFNFYMKEKSPFGEKLRQSITVSKASESPFFKLNSDKKCPLLTDNGLCSIYINLGEDKMCEICKLHPRFFEWYGEIKEGGVGLCCEEAACLVLKNNLPISFDEIEIGEKADKLDEVSDFMYGYLNDCRDVLYDIIQDENFKYDQKISIILDFAEKIQKNIDGHTFSVPEIINCRQNRKINLSKLSERFIKFDFLESENKKRFQKNYNMICQAEKNKLYFPKNTQTEKYCINIFIYFIMRYFMQGTYSDEILSAVRMAVASAEYLGFEFSAIYKESNNLDEYINAVRIFSSEIEYSEENIEAFADMMYDNEIFS